MVIIISVLQIAAEPDIVERVLVAAAPMEAKRFLIASDETIGSERAEDGSADVGEKVGVKLNSETCPLFWAHLELISFYVMQRKHSFLASNSELGIKEEVLWRANYEEFLHRFRHKVCFTCHFINFTISMTGMRCLPLVFSSSIS